MNCAACGVAVLADAKFCAECGTPVAHACRQCGTELTPTAKFCPECGTATGGGAARTSPEAVVASPVAERRVTSVLFGDLVGFTTLSESRDPEEVRELLGRYFDTAREIVARYGGTIEKFIGDAVMAVWGVPTAHEDDAERAVRAGLDLAEAVAAFGESVGAPGLAMRVGVVTGEVAVTLGATDQGMVAGDAVNTAARVQAKADPGTVWVDGQTRSMTGGSIDFREAGSHELKGKAEPVALYVATAVMGGVGGERSTDRVQAPLVGRRRELSVLKEMFHVAAEEHRPRLVVLSGDAGVGKTRMGWEFENYIDGLSATVLWHRGRCLAYGDGIAFSALTAAVRGRIGAGENDTESSTRDKLTRSLETYVPEAGERSQLHAALSNLLGLSGSSGLTREDLFSAWLTWFERLSRNEDESVVWVVDDAHYADDGFLDFIETLSTVAQAPLLIVLLARPELLARRPGLAALRRANVIGLETLSKLDIATLLDGLVEGLPTDVRDALVERAEGNPLFAIETVRAMHDQGLTADGPTRRVGAVRLATGVDTAALSALAAPASLQVLIASRLDLLPAQERSVLAAASVMGQTFTFGALEAVCEESDDLLAVLRELIGRDLLTTITDRLSSEEGQYAFVQTVVRTVAYQTQSRRDRLVRHLAAVTYYESLPDSDTEISAVIAQHLRDAMSLVAPDDQQHAEIATRLGRWLERSAERSIAVGAPSEALRALVEATTLTSTERDLVRLRLAAGEAGNAAGVFDEWIDHLLPIAAGELGADHIEKAQAVAAAVNGMRQCGRHDEVGPLIAPYLDVRVFDDLPALTASRLARMVGIYYLNMGDGEDSIPWTDRALGLAEDSGDPRETAACLNGYALSQFLRGHSRVGYAILNLAADFARENRLIAELAYPLVNLLAYGINRDLGAGLSAGAESMTLFEQTGNGTRSWHVAINQAIALNLAGRWDDVAAIKDRPLLREQSPPMSTRAIFDLESGLIAFARDDDVDLATLDTVGAASETGQPDNLDYMFYVACRALHARATEDSTTLRASCRRLVQLAHRYSLLDDDFPHLWTLAIDWLVEAQDYDGARELLHPVIDSPPTRWTPLLAAQLPRVRGTIEAADPDTQAAPSDIENDLLDGIAALDAFGAYPYRARGQAALGLWLTRQSRSAEAAPHLAAARATFTDLRATAWLRELDAALGLAAAG